MPYVTLPGGFTAHVRVARRARRRCSAEMRRGMRCSNFASFQCDYALGAGRTCDAHLCAIHATEVGTDVHHCPDHEQAQLGLFTDLVSTP